MEMDIVKEQFGGSKGFCIHEVDYGISFQTVLNLPHFTAYALMKYIARSVFKPS